MYTPVAHTPTVCESAINGKLSLSPLKGQDKMHLKKDNTRPQYTHRTTGCLDDRLLTMMTDTGFYVP